MFVLSAGNVRLIVNPINARIENKANIELSSQSNNPKNKND